MKRRQLLALSGTLAAGLAGCLDQFGDDSTGMDDTGDDPTPTDTPDPTPEPTPDTVLDPTYQAVWPTFQADPANTGTLDGSGPNGGPVVTWRSDTWGHRTSPVVGEETVYFGTGLYHPRIAAFDADTGELLWSQEVDDDVTESLALGGGVLYGAAESLFAFDAETGDRLWTALDNDEPEGVTVADDVAYTASRDRDLVVALDAATGDERWRRSITGIRITTPAVSGNSVYVASDSSVVRLDAGTGDTVWEIEPDEAVRTAPTVGEDLVFVTTRRGVQALDVETGDEVWTVEGRFRPVNPALAGRFLFLAGTVEDGDDRVTRALALDAATGEVWWSFEDEWLTAASPVVVDGVVYLPSRRNHLYALDAATGEKLWTRQFEWPVGTPAVADGRVFTSVGGRLTAVDGDGATPDHDAHPDLAPPDDPAPSEYAGSEMYFGSAGYDVTTTAEVDVEEDAPFEVTLDAEGSVIDEGEAVEFTFELANESDETLRIASGAPTPLGVVTLFGVDGTDGSITAWTDAYEESGHVHTTPHRGVRVNLLLLSEPVEPGERIGETYTLSTGTHAIQPGTYEFTGSYQVSPDGPGGDDGWAFDVRIAAELTQPEPEDGETVFDLAVPDEVSPPAAFVGDFSVEVLEPVTDLHPGLVEVSLTNDTDERAGIISPRDWPFGSYVGRAADGSRLVLTTADKFAPAYVEDGAGDGTGWTPAFLPHIESRSGRSFRAIDAGERVSKRYLVLAHPDDGGLSPGTYTFKQGYADRDVEFPWGFLLSLIES